MCGISGVVGLNNISEALSQGIRNLEYRGYDSCGIALIKKNNLVVRKNTGGVEEFFRKNDIFSEKSTIGIAHTRWATHGSVTHENSHPFMSCDEAFAVVHNGIISNYRLLREDLIGEGHKFYSETDTEVIPHLLEKYYKKYKNVETAFLSTLNVLEGTFAIVLISSYHPGQIFCARRESPLMIGIGDEQKFVGSDFNAFIDYTKNAIIIEDGEYAIISRDSYVVKSFLTREEVVKSITKIEWDSETAKKGGYPHYMLKEIYEQPQTINTALELDSSLMDQMVDTIHERKNTYFVGVGTTFYVAQFANYLFSSLSGRFIPAISSDEFISLAKVNNDSLVFALSQSGETFDTIRALKFAKSQGAKTAAIVNVMGSSISRQVDNVILQGSGPEISVISTKAAFAQMITMALLALKLGLKNKTIKRKEYDQSINALSELPNIIQNILNERSGFIHRIANRYSKIKNWLYLGRGIYYPVALESALKMKEVAYVHAEGMPGGFLKHGTLAMIDREVNSIVFIPPRSDKALYEATIHTVEEIRARSGFVLGLHFDERGKNKDLFSEEIILPNVRPIVAPFIQLVIGQLFAYFTAISLKRNIDKPRSLAKSVTVG